MSDLTGVKYVTSTDGEGIYTIPNLPPGPYRIQVSKPGFKALIKPDIILNVQDALSINFTLPIGASSVVVTVEGGAPLINTQSPAVSTVVDRNFVENMPLNGRSFQDLILLTPGVVTNSPQEGATPGASGEFSVNGQRTESNYYIVDGVSANGGTYPGVPTSLGTSGSLPAATALGTSQGLVSVDALEEFRVQSSTYSAEYGRNPGGQFSFVTRSGTNQWHGSAFEYLRNSVFDANEWFNDYDGLPKPPERQNDFGGTLGGPVEIPRLYDGKNRSFFFFSYEGLRLRQPQAALTTEVPTLSVRAAAPIALQPVLNAFPAPSCPSGAANCTTDLGNGLGDFVASWSNPNSIDALSLRFDQAVTGKIRLFFRLSDVSSASASRGAPAASDVQTLAFTTRTYTFGGTSAFTSRFSNELRLNYSSNVGMLSTQLDDFGGAQAVNLAQLQGMNTAANPSYRVDVGFFFGNFPGLSQSVVTSSQHQWNLVDTMGLSNGRHQLRFGLDYRRLTPTADRPNPYVFYYYYSASGVSTNEPGLAGASSYGPGSPLYTNLSTFVQDTWHLSSRLTLSLGLRWEVNPAPGVTRGFKPYTVQGAGDLATMTLAPEGTPLWQTNWHDFAPRLGAAYVLRNRIGFETVVRGGAGVFYDTGQQAGSIGFVGPGSSASCFPTLGIGCPLETQAGFPAASLSLPPAIVNPPVAPYSSMFAFPAHLQLPYTLQTNLSVEQALGRSQSVTLSYVGAFGRKLLEERQLNVAAINPNFSYVSFIQNGLSSDYNSLQVQMQRRLSGGLQLLGSYTLSRCLDYGSQDIAQGYSRADCDFDVRHSFSAAVSYDLPNRFENRVAQMTLRGWGIDDRLSARTAFPVTLDGGSVTDPVTQQVEFSGLNLVPDEPIYLRGAQYPGGRAINPNAFSLPLTGFGDAPRNFVRGFGAWQMDLAARREFPIHERLKLQFRAEAFNIFNHPNFGYIDPFFGDPTFGQATMTLASSLGGLSPLYQTGGPRSMQVALKLMF